MKIFVSGASGYIGRKVINELSKKNWIEEIVGLDIKEPAFNFSNFRFINQDIRVPLEPLFELEKFDAILHTAYILPPIHNKEQMEDINKNGTKNILEASRKSGVKQILYTSSTTAYGFFPDNDIPLTEESPLRGNDDFTYAKNKKEIEAIFREFTIANPETTISIVRPCFVVGPGFNNPLAKHLKKRHVILPSNHKPWQFVHEDDLVNIILLLLKGNIRGVFNVCGEGTISFKDIVQLLGNTLIPIPWPILSPLNNLFWKLRLSSITESPSSAMRMMMHPWIASSKKLIKKTGFQYKYDSKGAFEDFVQNSR